MGSILLKLRWIFLGWLAVAASSAQASTSDDPLPPILAGLALLFGAAKLGAWAMRKLRQPAVLGELLVGVALGNVPLIEGLLAAPGTATVFEALAGIGVILLLFEVGLESSVDELLQVGASATLVAVVGVIVPFGFGFWVSGWLLPAASVYTHAFIGATLCATSVGITARVLKDLGKLERPEAKVILGAAVIDDVLALIVLAVVQGVIIAADSGVGTGFEPSAVLWISAKAFGFLAVALVFGRKVAPYLFRFGARLKLEGMLLTLALVFCFGLAWLSAVAGLAPIVGAFAAGLVIDGAGFSRYFNEDGEETSLEDLLLPVSRFFVPLFFVLMGTKVKLAALYDPEVLALAAALTIVAILGKQACGLAVRGKGMSRLVVGLGMVPRGEVGLIFAMIGAGLTLGGERIIDAKTYGAIVIMVMATTMITPVTLRWALARPPRNQGK